MRKNRKLSIGVLLVFIMTVFGGFSLYAADLGDISEHWAQNDVQAMVDKGVVTGYPDNTFKPDNTITRAEFITIVNKAFSFNDSTQISYKDVKTTDWFAPQIARAEKAGYIAGYEDNTMRPNNNISRQEAAVIISRVLSIDTEKDIAEADKFIDAKIIPSWSKGAVAAVVKAGYMKGYPDGTFKAGAAITRAEAVVTLGRVLGLEPVGKTVFNKAGEYGPATGIETIDDNVTITVSGVTLKNMTINGDLTIAATVGAGDFTLRNITVTGTTYVNGGGANSGLLDGFKGDILINKDGVRLIATGKTSVDTITLNTYANLKEDSKLTANGFNNAILADSISAKTTTTIAGGFNDITIDAADVTLQMVAGSVISNLEINKNSTVKGSGKITYASVNSAGVVIDPTPDKTVIAKGLTAIIGGKEVSGTYLKPSTPGNGGGGPVVPPITEITSLDAAGTYDGDYRLVNLTQDTVLGPETDIAYITGTLYLDPGEVYDLKLRNIIANKIVVESGKTESITLLNVGVLSVLIIDDDNGVRIVAQDGTSIIETRIDKENQGDSTVLEVEGNGSLGTIKVNAAGKLTLKGDFGNHPVNVAGDGADINLGATAKVANVNVSGKAKVNAEAGAAVAQISITGSTEVELGGDMSGTAVAITAANAKVGIKENAQIGTISVEASATIDTAAEVKIDQVQVTKANTSIDLTGTGSVETVSVTEEAQGSTVKVNAAVNQLKVAANVTLEGDKADTISEVVVEGEDVEISASEEVANALKTKAIAKAQAALNSLPANPSSLKLAADYQNVIDALGSVNAIKAFDSNFDTSELENIDRLDGAVTQIFTLAVADAKDKVEIGFAGTDTANAITQKVTLPTTVGDYGVTVTWSFDPTGIILSNGTVNRPSDQDAEVTATATLKRGNQTDTMSFNLIVKCKEKVAKPTANPEPGPVTKGSAISLSTDTEGAIIYYTLNNADPTASSTRYITPIVIDADTTIKAIAVKAGMLDSDMATFAYTIAEVPDRIAEIVQEIQNIYQYIDETDKQYIRHARSAIGTVADNDWNTILEDLLTDAVKDCFNSENEAEVEMIKFAKALGDIYYSTEDEELETTLRDFKHSFRDSFQILFGTGITVEDLYELLIAAKAELPEVIKDSEYINKLAFGTDEELVETIPEVMKKALGEAIKDDKFTVFRGKLAEIGWSVDLLIDVRGELSKEIDVENKAELALGKAMVRSEAKLSGVNNGEIYPAIGGTIELDLADMKSYRLWIMGKNATGLVDWFVIADSESPTAMEDNVINHDNAKIEDKGNTLEITPKKTGDIQLVAIRGAGSAYVAEDWILKVDISVA